MNYDLSGLLPIFLAPKDGSSVTLVGLYSNGWSREVICVWSEKDNAWTGWSSPLSPTHYFLPSTDDQAT